MITAFLLKPKLNNEGQHASPLKHTPEKEQIIQVEVEALNLNNDSDGVSSILKEVNLSEKDIISATARICGLHVKFWTDMEGMIAAPRLDNSTVIGFSVVNTEGIEIPLMGNILLTGEADDGGSITGCPLDVDTILRHLSGTSLKLQ